MKFPTSEVRAHHSWPSPSGMIFRRTLKGGCELFARASVRGARSRTVQTSFNPVIQSSRASCFERTPKCPSDLRGQAFWKKIFFVISLATSHSSLLILGRYLSV